MHFTLMSVGRDLGSRVAGYDVTTASFADESL